MFEISLKPNKILIREWHKLLVSSCGLLKYSGINFVFVWLVDRGKCPILIRQGKQSVETSCIFPIPCDSLIYFEVWTYSSMFVWTDRKLDIKNWVMHFICLFSFYSLFGNTNNFSFLQIMSQLVLQEVEVLGVRMLIKVSDHWSFIFHSLSPWFIDYQSTLAK